MENDCAVICVTLETISSTQACCSCQVIKHPVCIYWKIPFFCINRSLPTNTRIHSTTTTKKGSSYSFCLHDGTLIFLFFEWSPEPQALSWLVLSTAYCLIKVFSLYRNSWHSRNDKMVEPFSLLKFAFQLGAMGEFQNSLISFKHTKHFYSVI